MVCEASFLQVPFREQAESVAPRGRWASGRGGRFGGGRLRRGLVCGLPPAVVAAEVADLDDQPGQAQRAVHTDTRYSSDVG